MEVMNGLGGRSVHGHELNTKQHSKDLTRRVMVNGLRVWDGIHTYLVGELTWHINLKLA